MEPTEHPAPEQPSATRRFFSGFFTGAANSLLLTGIMYGLLFATYSLFGGFAAATQALLHITPVVIVAAVGIYGGIKAVWNGGEPREAAVREETTRNVTLGVAGAALAQTPLLSKAEQPAAAPDTPEMAAPPATKWADRPDIAASHASVAGILDKGSRADANKGLAAAILAEQQSAAPVAVRA